MNVHERALHNWMLVLEKIRPIAKGCTVPHAKLMMEDYWHEVHEVDVRIGELALKSRLHPKSYRKYFKKSYKKISNQSISFNTHVQKVVDGWLSAPDKGLFIQFFNTLMVVDYLSKRALESLVISFDVNGNLVMPDSHLSDWTKIAKENQKVAPSFCDFIESNDGSQTTKLLPDSTYIYVLDTTKTLRIIYKAKSIQHSSLVAGGAVLSTGKFKIQKNVITRISAISGHYKPTEDDLIIILRYLESQCVKTEAIEFRTYTGLIKRSELLQKICKGTRVPK